MEAIMASKMAAVVGGAPSGSQINHQPEVTSAPPDIFPANFIQSIVSSESHLLSSLRPENSEAIYQQGKGVVQKWSLLNLKRWYFGFIKWESVIYQLGNSGERSNE